MSNGNDNGRLTEETRRLLEKMTEEERRAVMKMLEEMLADMDTKKGAK